MGSKVRACLMAELRAPALSRFNLFHVDIRTLTDGGRERCKNVEEKKQLINTLQKGEMVHDY